MAKPFKNYCRPKGCMTLNSRELFMKSTPFWTAIWQWQLRILTPWPYKIQLEPAGSVQGSPGCQRIPVETVDIVQESILIISKQESISSINVQASISIPVETVTSLEDKKIRPFSPNQHHHYYTPTRPQQKAWDRQSCQWCNIFLLSLNLFLLPNLHISQIQSNHQHGFPS